MVNVRTPSNQSDFLALIPAYNESTRIAAVIKAAKRILPVLVIDDGSLDGTAAIANGAGAEVVIQRPNQGKGAALRLGFRYALENDYQAAITLDADGQHDPADIPKFVNTFITEHPDLVIGCRDFGDMPPLRRLANTLGEKTFSFAIGRHIPDNQSGYRLVSRRLMEALVDGTEKGFEFELEMIVTCVKKGFYLTSVPVNTIYAGESSHISNLHHLKHFLRVTWRTRQERKQLANR